MKSIIKWLSVIVVFISLPVSVKLCAQTSVKNQLSISVAGIEYDDAGFTKLKESMKANKKVQDLKQSYSQNTAKLSLDYAGDATALWDELPATVKQLFKITSIDNKRIELQLKNSNTANIPPHANTETKKNTSQSNDDCKNCYWNLCNYDVLKSFVGKVYKGINYDDGTYYFNCDNGILVKKIIIVNGYGVTTEIKTDTILISSGPVGTTWGVSSWGYEGNDLLKTMGFDLASTSKTGHTLIAKNITTKVDGKTYTDVIVINEKGYSTSSMFGNTFYSNNYYYAKAVGLIKTDTLNFDSDPVAAINKTSDIKTVYSGGSTVTNGIDASITGIWKFHDATTNADGFYKFNADGTFEYYKGSVAEANKITGIHHWQIEKGGYDKNGAAILDLTWATGGGNAIRYELTKKNDPTTGKPGITFNGAMLISADNKAPWK